MNEQMSNKVPVPNHVHGRVGDINKRLALVRNQFDRVLDRLRPSVLPEGEASEKLTDISQSVQSKLDKTSNYVKELETLACEFEEFIGSSEETPKASAVRLG